MKPWQNRNILLVSVGFFLIFFGYGAAQQFIIPIFKTFGGETIALTSLIILYTTFAFGTILSPKLISKFGSRRSFVISSIVYATFVFSISFGNQYLLYLVSFLQGLAGSMLFVNVGSYIIRVTKPKERGESFGFQTSLFILGNLLGTAATTFLLNFVTTQNIFLILSAFSFSGLIPFLGVKDLKTKISGRSFSDVYKVFLDKKIALLIPAIFITFFLWAQMFSSVNLIIQKSFGLQYVGIAGTLFYLIFFFSAYIVGYLTKNFKKQNMLAVLLTLGVVGIATFIMQINLVFAFLSIVLMSIFISTGFPVALNLMKDISKFDSETVAGAFNLVNSIGVLGSLISVTILKEIVSLNIAFVLGLISIASLFLILVKKI